MSEPTTTDAGLDGMLAAHAAADPRRPALVLPGSLGTTRTVTFGTLARRVEDAAAGLVAAGIGPDTRTALLVPPIADFFVLDRGDRKSTRLNSSHSDRSRMPSSA